MSATTQPAPSAPLRIGLVAFQVVLLSLIWIGADYVSRHYLPKVPSSLLGLGVVLVLLVCGMLRREWFAHGAGWLIRDMLLFFVPAVIAIIQYPDLIRSNGLAVLGVILGSTVCVMVSTALAVDATWRLQDRLEARRTPQQQEH